MSEILTDQLARLNSGMYRIVGKDTHDVPFRLNAIQARLYSGMWYRTLIPKARQEGVSTFCELFALDTCLVKPNQTAVVIAHTQDDAKRIFQTKVLYPYLHLPEKWKQASPLSREPSESRLLLENGSSITVDVGARSGTVSILHVSEFGTICAKSPNVADEIIAGSLEAVPKDGVVWFESTCMGRSGYFWDLCEAARKVQDSGTEPLPMEFDLHFIPWWLCPEYRVDAAQSQVTPEIAAYFQSIGDQIGRTLDPQQMAWYASKARTLGPKVKQEYPSTYEEAWETALEGAYWTEEIRGIRAKKQIGTVVVQGVPVDTWWDLGMDDSNCVWFTQDVGREIHVVDFYENSGLGLRHYADVLRDRQYVYGRHYAPHDIQVRELGPGLTRWEQALELGIRFDVVPRVENKLDAIEAARKIIPRCWFDESKCGSGLEHLELYRREWDDTHGCWKNHPCHDEHSNAADAFMTLACGKAGQRTASGSRGAGLSLSGSTM